MLGTKYFNPAPFSRVMDKHSLTVIDRHCTQNTMLTSLVQYHFGNKLI
jgi:hypothetical protein